MTRAMRKVWKTYWFVALSCHDQGGLRLGEGRQVDKPEAKASGGFGISGDNENDAKMLLGDAERTKSLSCADM